MAQAPTEKPAGSDRHAAAEDREARQAASIGAQVILDYNEDAAVAARGGAAATMDENVAIRDKHLLSLGLDPLSPSGPPVPGRAKAAAKEPAPPDPALKVPAKATRASSLAAG
jgi:hypothetical protein